MNVEQVIWTVLPKEIDADGRLIVSVHVAPRLLTDDDSLDPLELGEFAAFRDWPSRLAGLRFQLDFGGEVVDAKPIEEADSTLWQALFPKHTLTRPHRFTDHATRSIHTFPVRDVLAFVKETYGALSAAGPDLPSIDDPTGPLAAFAPLEHIATQVTDASSFWDELARAQEKAAAGKPLPGETEVTQLPVGTVVKDNVSDPGLPWSQQAAQQALFEAYRFYHRPGSQRPDFPDDYIEPPPDVPEFDFHETVSLLADHPRLLRMLGLVVDLVVEREDPTNTLPAQGVVRLIPDGELPEQPPRCPGTRYELAEDWFGARPLAGYRIRRGLLNLTPEFWDLFQVDVDGAALQAVGFGDTLGALLDPDLRNAASPSETGAPALRSAGLALARQQRGETLLEDLVGRRLANDAIEKHHPVEFNAEDLVRGYRVDVWDADATGGARWRSLHERVVEHAVDGLPEPIRIEDEGFAKSTAASSEREDHPTPSDDLYLHETVVAWDGWSLAAPRPGKRIVEPGEGENGSTVAPYDPAADQVLPVVSSARVAPGSLPRLRIGHTYRLRVRTVDLAGNSRPAAPKDFEPADPDLESESQLYVRFEPVPSPTILRRHLDTEGESLEHLVIRSNVDTTAAAYAASPAVKAALEEAGAEHVYAADSQRHLAPPKGSLQMAEQDGKLDPIVASGPNGTTTALRLALREEGTFLDPKIVHTGTGKKTIDQTPIKLFPADATLPTERGAGLASAVPKNDALRGAYAYYPDPDKALVLPYLPDPLAIGVSLTGYDFSGGEQVHLVALFPAKWPALEPIRLRLSESKPGDPPTLVFVGKVLEARLPQSWVIYGHLSSVFPADRLDHFAIWQWTPEAAQGVLKGPTLEGRHWMLTPFRRVTLTHAVQQPLAVPDMTKVVSSRVLGSTFAEFRGPIKNHARSTGHLDVHAAWTEDVDLLTDDLPRWREGGNPVEHVGHAFGFDLTPGEDLAQVTKPGSPAKPPAIPLPTADRLARHEFGDTKYRRVTYHSVATTRFREFLPPSIAADPEQIQRVEPTEVGGTPTAALVHDIPSSARPAAPDVMYVLPTFRWERHDDGPVRTHVRRGKAVRVWLRRPWFSSGDGELLGVVLEPKTTLPGSWTIDGAVIDSAVAGLAASGRAAASASAGPARRKPAARKSASIGHLVESRGSRFAAGPEALLGGLEIGPIFEISAGPTNDEIAQMLQGYVTKWGSDPVWRSRLPDLVPTTGDFPRAVASRGGLTLDELPPAARVAVAGHEVQFDPDRLAWYADIEIAMGESYFPFVRLALARFQPHSLDGAHLSRVVMSDFMQVAPDRTAELARGRGAFGITVRGYAGQNIVGKRQADLSILPPSKIKVVPNTTMRAAVERRPPGVPGDLGWERVGAEVTLKAASTSSFHVTWTGSLTVPKAPAGHAQRIVVTEIETFPRDPMPGDSILRTSPADRVRERIVYADTFEL